MGPVLLTNDRTLSMEISELRVFEAVARHGNMNRAAGELNMVQSNVTARIRQLESEFNVRLFERHSRGVTLTSAGVKLLPFASKAMAIVTDAKKALADGDEPTGELVVGALETTLAMRLSGTLADFAARCPRVDLTIRTGTTAELVQMVLDHRIEGAFVCGPVRHVDLQEVRIFREDLAVMSCPQIDSLDAVFEIENLKQIVLRSGCSYRQRLDEIFARRGVVASRVLEFATLESIFASVAAGVGITLMPSKIAEDFAFRHAVRVHRLPRVEGKVETMFVTRKNAYISHAHEAFLRHVSSAATQEC